MAEVKVAPKIPELDLEAERLAQATRLAELFASELGMSRGEYIASLPAFLPQPDAYKGRFDIPLIVPVYPKLGLDKILRIAGIKPYHNASEITDWQDRSHGFITPQVPYTTWVDDGSGSLGKTVGAVRNHLAADERGGAVFDGLALYLKNPGILKKRFLDLPGSHVAYISAPSLSLWLGKPSLRSGWVINAGSHFGSVRAGREINTQPSTS